MYGEDLDWCYRIQRAGWKIFYTPDTQIIHYKGESTKKGELRYVRLFYGAMLRFVEKHLSSAPEAGTLQHLSSRLLALGIRCGIVARALLTFVAQMFAATRRPLLDFAVASATMALGAWLWSVQAEAFFRPSFYTVVLPGYAAIATAAIGLAGGYRRGYSRRFRPLLIGLLSAFVGIATLSFFVKDIAFSRAVLVLGFGLTTVALFALRLRRRVRSRSPARPPRRRGRRGRPAPAAARRPAPPHGHLPRLRRRRDAARVRRPHGRSPPRCPPPPARPRPPPPGGRHRLRRRLADEHDHSGPDAAAPRPAGAAQDPGLGPGPDHREGVHRGLFDPADGGRAHRRSAAGRGQPPPPRHPGGPRRHRPAPAPPAGAAPPPEQPAPPRARRRDDPDAERRSPAAAPSSASTPATRTLRPTGAWSPASFPFSIPSPSVPPPSSRRTGRTGSTPATSRWRSTWKSSRRPCCAAPRPEALLLLTLRAPGSA